MSAVTICSDFTTVKWPLMQQFSALRRLASVSRGSMKAAAPAIVWLFPGSAMAGNHQHSTSRVRISWRTQMPIIDPDGPEDPSLGWTLDLSPNLSELLLPHLKLK